MIVGVDNGVVTFLTAQNLNGAVGDDFICIHVSGRTCTALDGVADKLVMKLSGKNLVTNLANGIFDFGVKFSHVVVANCAGFFDFGKGIDELSSESLTGYLKVFKPSQGLNTVVSIDRYLLGTNRVFFYTI
jgi:hypothetical protein